MARTIRTEVPDNDKPLAAEDLGDKLRALREEKQLSLKNLAEAVGVSYTYLSEVERGTATPAVDTIKRLAEVLEVPTSLFIYNKRKSGITSEKLRYIRKLKGLSQKDLAKLAGVSPGLVAQLELGSIRASLKTLEKLGDALGVSVCYLMLDREDVEGVVYAISTELRNHLQNPKVQAIIGSICTLTDEQLKLVFNFINMLDSPSI